MTRKNTNTKTTTTNTHITFYTTQQPINITNSQWNLSLPPNTAKEVLNLAFENIFITIILVSMIVPICEEVFFRGFLINGLERKFNLKISLLISSGIFSIFHIHIGSLFPTFILGICLGLLYIKSKSIYPSIFIHSIHNFLAVIISKYYL